MADFTITSPQVGAYEIPLTAGVQKTVLLALSGVSSTRVTLMVHSGTSPVYFKDGASAVTVTSGDQTSTIALAGQYVTIDASANATIAMISAAAAVVSIFTS